MIRTDGIRSLKRKWFAEKLLRAIRDMGIMAKTLVWDGFKFKVVSLSDELSSGNVSAPMGCVVICAKDTYLAICSSEFWLSGFSVERNMFSKNTDITEGYANEAITSPQYIYNTAEIPVLLESQHGNCRPVLIPIGDSEYIFSTLSVVRQYGSLIAESVIQAFCTNGSHTRRRSFSIEADSAYLSRQLVQLLPSNYFRAVRTNIGAYFRELNGIDVILCSIWQGENLSNFKIRKIFSSVAWAGLPSELYAVLVLSYPGKTQGLFLGSYAYAESATKNVILLTAVTCVKLHYSLNSFFINPETGLEIIAHREWRLFYTIVREQDDLTLSPNVSIITARSFLPLLDTLANGKIFSGGTDIDDPNTEIDWDIAAEMLTQLLPYPNTGHIVPHDSIMFHAEDGIYTWTRHYGAVKFTTTGIETASIEVPSAVSDNEGIMPEITYAGNGIYSCVCKDVGNKIRAIHIGSPFTGWVAAIVMPIFDLLYVRPLLVSDKRVVMAGVVKDTSVEGKISCRLAVFDTKKSIEKWDILAAIPIEYEMGNNWDLSFYGDGEYTRLIRQYLSPPPATPQAFLLPYADYQIVGA